MKKHIRQVGVAGMIVASLATGPGALAAQTGAGRPARSATQTADARRTREAIYQARLSFLSQVLDTDHRELELSLTRLANQQEVGPA